MNFSQKLPELKVNNYRIVFNQKLNCLTFEAIANAFFKLFLDCLFCRSVFWILSLCISYVKCIYAFSFTTSLNDNVHSWLSARSHTFPHYHFNDISLTTCMLTHDMEHSTHALLPPTHTEGQRFGDRGTGNCSWYASFPHLRFPHCTNLLNTSGCSRQFGAAFVVDC